ncbi:hypothetical protein NM208_g4787 [Fusarium decemcellulare]|uniref:Uncharacterized protein n=1 Tax=Fusarium decemcellulare TaxID=57161 RepID=A0ACC1SJH5_9HYPO|nr:hypothetical protein NM208_g4787 [Fusarium decemcellulare]
MTPIVISLCLGSISYGYDFSIITFTIGQPAWYAYFGLTTDPSDAALYKYSNDIVGAALGLFSTGAIIGAGFVAWVCDARGRKKSLIIAAIINIVGGALQAGSVHIAMFLTARALTGISAAMFVTVVPIYIAEVAPPSTRGLLVGQHGAFFSMWLLDGSMGLCWIVFQHPSATVSMALPARSSGAMADIGPVHLIIQGRPDEAWDILHRLHFNPKNSVSSEAFAKEEFYQIRSQIATDLAAYGHVSLVDLFKKPHFAKRMACAALVMFTSQACGNLVFYSNATILFSGLGFDTGLSLVMSAAYITWACVMNFVNASFLDRLGRVRSMVIGYVGGGVCIAIEAAIIAVYGGTTNRAALSGGVFILFCYITTFAGFCDTTLYVYCSEIFPTHIRSKGMAWSIAIFMLSTVPFLESSTVGFATIGWKYYIMFIVFSVLCPAALHIFCPETRGLALEEVNELFGDDVAVQVTNLSQEERDQLDNRIMIGISPLSDGMNDVADQGNDSKDKDLSQGSSLSV